MLYLIFFPAAVLSLKSNNLAPYWSPAAVGVTELLFLKVFSFTLTLKFTGWTSFVDPLPPWKMRIKGNADCCP